MVGFKYLVANYIYSTRTPYGIDKKRIINFMETIENVSYEKGVEYTLDIILKDLVKDNLIAIRHGKIFVRPYEEKWELYMVDMDIRTEEVT